MGPNMAYGRSLKEEQQSLPGIRSSLGTTGFRIQEYASKNARCNRAFGGFCWVLPWCLRGPLAFGGVLFLGPWAPSLGLLWSFGGGFWGFGPLNGLWLMLEGGAAVSARTSMQLEGNRLPSSRICEQQLFVTIVLLAVVAWRQIH